MASIDFGVLFLYLILNFSRCACICIQEVYYSKQCAILYMEMLPTINRSLINYFLLITLVIHFFDFTKFDYSIIIIISSSITIMIIISIIIINIII